MDEFLEFVLVHFELLNMHRTMLRNGVCTRSWGNFRQGFKIISIHFSRTFFKMSRKPRSLGQLEASTISWLIVSESMRNACTEIWIEICAPHTSTSSSTGNSNYGEYYLRVVELFKTLCLELYRSNNREYIYIRNKIYV